MELYGGTISVHSAGRGAGSSFRIAFPLISTGKHTPESRELLRDPNRAIAPSDSASLLSVERLDGLSVLVVDDEIDSRVLVRRLLEERGACVILAASTDEALATLDHRVPDVLISDIGMPGQDGYALIRQIRALPGPAANVSAIALTAYARTEDRAKAMGAGYQRHLSKPVEPRDLVAAIQDLLRRPAVAIA